VDALIVARFWASVLGGEVDSGSTSDKAYVDDMVVMRDPEGQRVLRRDLTGAGLDLRRRRPSAWKGHRSSETNDPASGTRPSSTR
jgi:hypothetical protein